MISQGKAQGSKQLHRLHSRLFQKNERNQQANWLFRLKEQFAALHT